MTIQQFKTSAIKSLSTAEISLPAQSANKTQSSYISPSASLDINVLLEHFLQKDKTYILSHSDDELTSEQFSLLSDAVAKRKTGLPIAYITGHKEFFGYDFIVSPDVLIPKPDTEILVENAIDEIVAKMENRPEIVLSVCDMCAGSGCIGISVLKNLIEEYKIPSGRLPKFTFCDISGEALQIAKQNANRLLLQNEVEEIKFIQTNLFSEVPYTFDLILSNPPYIPSKMVTDLLKDGRSEPRLALDGDVGTFGEATQTNDGLSIIRRLIPESYEHLVYNGSVLIETGEYNAKQALSLLKEQGFRCAKIFKDLEEQDRDIYGVK